MFCVALKVLFYYNLGVANVSSSLEKAPVTSKLS